MSAGGSQGEGLQVVQLGQNEQRYWLDEEALHSVLLQPEVRDLPVVVVSVAGAYRGGKSFILDFFLRYLNAPRASQLSGEWLGREDQPLEGFHWRGGCERDTSGILLWSKPILATLSTGEKVVVVLMDTQGTFDSETTIGENSTIFALSTLISSVQIYNLSKNIKEDDLQHLQLFTEYGKLATDGSGKAFQTLLFLVRDWGCAYEYPHGFNGGQSLLNKRLQSSQKKELTEVREQIRSCFDDIKCFLMPNPGSIVEEQFFDGSLKDIDEKFRLALLELVPALFDANSLKLKMINGQRVTARDLVNYIKKYVDVYNSNDMPEAVTVFKATAEACLSAASHEARDAYEAHVSSAVREHVSVPPDVLAACLSAAQQLALHLFHNKKKLEQSFHLLSRKFSQKLGSQQDIEHHLLQLQQELEARKTFHIWNNEAKLRDSMAHAKQAYEMAMNRVSEGHARFCLDPRELDETHTMALAEALASFDSTREVPNPGEDEERKAFIKNLNDVYIKLSAMNAQSNKSAVMEARDLFLTRMSEHQGGVGKKKLKRLASNATQQATELFYSKRNKDTRRDDDPYLLQLQQEIDACLTNVEKNNLKNIKADMQVAEYNYNNLMMEARGPPTCCFHPRALKAIHEETKKKVLQEFFATKTDTDQEQEEKLTKMMDDRFTALNEINEYNNEQAVDDAFQHYTRLMDKRSRPTLGSLLIVPLIYKIAKGLPEYHIKAASEARNEFYSRRLGKKYSDDQYVDSLKSKINDAFRNYVNPGAAIMREVGMDED